MDEPAAWRELAAQFKKLWKSDHNQLKLYASWSSFPINDQGDYWYINGSDDAVTESFRSLSERAGVLLGQPAGWSTLFHWLDLLKENSPHFKSGGHSESLHDDGTVTRAETGTIASLCLASAEYCYRLETKAIANLDPSAARNEIISSNLEAWADVQARREHLVQKKLNELSLAEALADVVNIVDEAPPAQTPAGQRSEAELEAERAAERRALHDAYMVAFPEFFILDICWAAHQRYREWTRWINGKLKDGSKPDRLFRAVLTSKKKPKEYRVEPRPKNWK